MDSQSTSLPINVSSGLSMPNQEAREQIARAGAGAMTNMNDGDHQKRTQPVKAFNRTRMLLFVKILLKCIKNSGNSLLHQQVKSIISTCVATNKLQDARFRQPLCFVLDMYLREVVPVSVWERAERYQNAFYEKQQEKRRIRKRSREQQQQQHQEEASVDMQSHILSVLPLLPTTDMAADALISTPFIAQTPTQEDSSVQETKPLSQTQADDLTVTNSSVALLSDLPQMAVANFEDAAAGTSCSNEETPLEPDAMLSLTNIADGIVMEV